MYKRCEAVSAEYKAADKEEEILDKIPGMKERDIKIITTTKAKRTAPKAPFKVRLSNQS